MPGMLHSCSLECRGIPAAALDATVRISSRFVSFFNIAESTVCKYAKPCQDPAFSRQSSFLAGSQSVKRRSAHRGSSLVWGDTLVATTTPETSTRTANALRNLLCAVSFLLLFKNQCMPCMLLMSIFPGLKRRNNFHETGLAP